MTPRLVFRPQAEWELLEARRWYEDQRPELGRTFAAAVDKTLAGIVQNPLAYLRAHGETRRALVPRFPYAIYFHIVADELIVLAVMRGRRLPKSLAIAALRANMCVQAPAGASRQDGVEGCIALAVPDSERWARPVVSTRSMRSREGPFGYRCSVPEL